MSAGVAERRLDLGLRHPLLAHDLLQLPSLTSRVGSLLTRDLTQTDRTESQVMPNWSAINRAKASTPSARGTDLSRNRGKGGAESYRHPEVERIHPAERALAGNPQQHD
jgi:hypothetical protein